MLCSQIRVTPSSLENPLIFLEFHKFRVNLETLVCSCVLVFFPKFHWDTTACASPVRKGRQLVLTLSSTYALNLPFVHLLSSYNNSTSHTLNAEKGGIQSLSLLSWLSLRQHHPRLNTFTWLRDARSYAHRHPEAELYKHTYHLLHRPRRPKSSESLSWQVRLCNFDCDYKDEYFVDWCKFCAWVKSSGSGVNKCYIFILPRPQALK